MKLKSLPEDFYVEEITHVRPSRGPFALYKLEKRGIGTPEAITAILRDWNIPRRAVNYGGLKDRHAITVQYLTIHKGPNQPHEDRSYRLEYLGQCAEPYHANDIASNRFSIRLRNFQQDECESIQRRCESLQSLGMVNYFDDQRFGSIGYNGELIGVPWCLGQYEKALFLAMAEPNPHDRGREREQKEIMRQHWGDWGLLKQKLDRSHRRSVVTYLVDHPTGFKRAVALIRQDMRSIYLAAFQSWVWNRWLSKLIENRFDKEEIVYFNSKCGPLAMPLASASKASDRWNWLKSLTLPLPSSRQHEWDNETLPELDEILHQLGMERREMRLKYPRDTFFSKGKRAAWLQPNQLEFKWSNDDMNNRRLALDLKFELPRGCYATMIVRAIAERDFGDDSTDLDDPNIESESSEHDFEAEIGEESSHQDT